jgi:hypothetical protein
MQTIYNKDSILWKRMNGSTFDLTKTTPTWFGLSDNIDTTYGQNMFKLCCKRDLKLLDIMSWEFRIDFMTRLSQYFQGRDLEDN